jgi:hypothetical protein
MDNNYFDVNFRYSGEEFKKYKDFDKYLISNYGRVLSLERKIPQKLNSFKILPNRIVKPRDTEKGYDSVILYKDGKQNSFRLHRLVYLAFIGDIPNKMQINHLNAIKKDNRLNNLELVTHQQNMDHAKKLGLIKGHKGVNNHASKLSNFKVRMIRESYKKGLQTITELSNYYDISYTTASRIVNYKMWKHIK